MRRVIAAVLLTLGTVALAQEGNHGDGHDKWHETFYQGLRMPDNPGVSCCSLADCRPTQGRAVGDHYEVLVDGGWTRVLPEKIVKTSAPDNEFHVCAPIRFDGNPEHVYCVVLPPEA